MTAVRVSNLGKVVDVQVELVNMLPAAPVDIDLGACGFAVVRAASTTHRAQGNIAHIRV